MKTIRIISLGEIVPMNIDKGVTALSGIIAQKTGMPSHSILPRVAQVAQAKTQMNALDHFKQGTLTETNFDALMVKAYCDEFQADLKDQPFTTKDFNEAWAEMNPDFLDFAAPLASAKQFNKQKDCKLIFISYTNPKDMRHLKKMLDDYRTPYELDQGELCQIDGMALYTSYTRKLTKSELITTVVNLFSAKNGFALFHGNDPNVDIKYIHGVNGIQGMDAMRKAFDATDAAVQEAAEGLHVDSILWNKDEVRLYNLLRMENPEHGIVQVAKL